MKYETLKKIIKNKKVQKVAGAFAIAMALLLAIFSFNYYLEYRAYKNNESAHVALTQINEAIRDIRENIQDDYWIPDGEYNDTSYKIKYSISAGEKEFLQKEEHRELFKGTYITQNTYMAAVYFDFKESKSISFAEYSYNDEGELIEVERTLELAQDKPEYLIYFDESGNERVDRNSFEIKDNNYRDYKKTLDSTISSFKYIGYALALLVAYIIYLKFKNAIYFILILMVVYGLVTVFNEITSITSKIN